MATAIGRCRDSSETALTRFSIAFGDVRSMRPMPTSTWCSSTAITRSRAPTRTCCRSRAISGLADAWSSTTLPRTCPNSMPPAWRRSVANSVPTRGGSKACTESGERFRTSALTSSISNSRRTAQVWTSPFVCRDRPPVVEPSGGSPPNQAQGMAPSVRSRLAAIVAQFVNPRPGEAAGSSSRGRPSSNVVRILGVIAATIAILLLRSPDMATHPAFLEEETGGWWSATFVRSPLETLVTPWNGSIYVLPRAGFLVARLLPVWRAPQGASIVFILTLALLAGFIASRRLAEAIPGDYVRALVGVGVVLLPFDKTFVYATILDAPFWLAIYLALLLVATPPLTRAWKIADVLGAAVAAFSGPPDSGYSVERVHLRFSSARVSFG